jgi:hypothetical protein
MCVHINGLCWICQPPSWRSVLYPFSSQQNRSALCSVLHTREALLVTVLHFLTISRCNNNNEMRPFSLEISPDTGYRLLNAALQTNSLQQRPFWDASSRSLGHDNSPLFFNARKMKPFRTLDSFPLINSFIRHGPDRKQRVQQFFYCCVYSLPR